MINLSTPSKELLDELLSDYKKADYWLTKQLGGLKKQKELGDNLCLKCLKECKEFAVSEPVEYISPKGNRWFMYVSARRYKDHFYTTPLGFCYYETYGSVGAFVPTQCGSENANACVIFTSHFFLRMCSRLNIKVRSRDIMSIDANNEQIMQNALFEIIDKNNTEQEKANAFWEAVYWLLGKFNDNLDKSLIINESYKYIEELEYGS